MHDLDALYLVSLASDRVVVLFEDEQGIVVIERELGVVREGNIRVALDQVRVLDVDGSGYFIAVGVLQVEDQDEVLGVANAVELDDDAAGGCCRVKPLSATTGATRVDIAEDVLLEEPQRQQFTFLYRISSDTIRRLGCTNPVLVDVGDHIMRTLRERDIGRRSIRSSVAG